MTATLTTSRPGGPNKTPPPSTGKLNAARKSAVGPGAPLREAGELLTFNHSVEEQRSPLNPGEQRSPLEIGEHRSPQQDDSASPPFDIPDWAGTVDRIRAGDQGAMAELYTVFTRGIRYLLLRSLGVEEVDDRVHDCFVIVAEAIRSGELRDPSRLMGYVRTVVRRHIAASIEDAISRRRTTVEFEDSVFSVSDWKNNPEQNLLARQRAEIARRVFNGVSRRDREILRRFYLLEQPQELICEEMGLTYNQFRLLKSRAKARFGKLGQRLAENGSHGFTTLLIQNKDKKTADIKAEKATDASH